MRDPAKVGIFWQTPLTVADTEREAKAHRDRLLTTIPKEAAGAYLSHNIGCDLSTLSARFSPKELNARIAATEAFPVSFVYKLVA